MTPVNFTQAAFAAIASLLLLSLGQPALAQGYPPRIEELIVDSYDALILIAGEGFDENSPPVVLLDDDPLPLDLLSVTEYEIQVALPEVPDGDYLLQVEFSGACEMADPGCSALHIYSFDITIGVPECGNAAIDPGEECDDGNLEDGDGCSSECRVPNPCEERCREVFPAVRGAVGSLDPDLLGPDANLSNMSIDAVFMLVMGERQRALQMDLQRDQCLQACTFSQGGSSDRLRLMNSRSSGQSQATEVIKKNSRTMDEIISNIR
jgi:cysteine-rich repeat protein